MNQKGRFILFILFVTSTLSAQTKEYPDSLKDENDRVFFCKILEIKNRFIKYRIAESSTVHQDKIVFFKDIHLSDSTKVKNKLNTKIVKPENGYANVYIYNGENTGFKVFYNGKELIKIKGGSFYLHKIEANKFHSYYSSNAKTLVEINAQNGEIYFIKGKMVSEQNLGYGNNIGFSHELIKDDSDISKYAILSMKKRTTD